MLFLVFWLLIFLVFHSYVIYPLLLRKLTRRKQLPPLSSPTTYPKVYVVLSVYNGARVLLRNLQSISASDYPKDKLFAFIGSDASEDQTPEILRQFASGHSWMNPFLFTQRRGKIKVINELLVHVPPDAVVIMADVSAAFAPHTISCLVKRLLNNADTGLVGANIVKGEHRSDGISYQEKAYYARELEMKYSEGVLWGAAMGAFGACYAIRKKDIKPVPDNFLVDDFFMTMQVLQQGKKALYDMDALVYMDLPNTSGVEFQRKVRISAGNFQNLKLFWPMLFQWNGRAFAFWSHKVLRWMGPFIIPALLVVTAEIRHMHPVYQWAWYLQWAMLLTPIVNYFAEKLQIHLKLLKFAAHFYLMNLGVLVGFIRFCKGIKNNVWQPTQR
jgi:cellulose synthase/poly-beta-1,6-N-acetylglucosamine synthase-like glycosyltransferase